jgi:hypothetical protein
MNLHLDSNWTTIFNATYTASLSTTGRPNPIDKIYVPYDFTNQFVRIYLKSESAEPHWWLGGKLIQLIQSDSPFDFEVQPLLRIPLNRITLFEAKLIAPQYQLKFEPAKWLKEIAIVIEQYIGE